jgi:sugar phosphate isomerase/epimerase
MPYGTTYFRSIRQEDDLFKIITRLGFKAEIYFEYGWTKHSLNEHKELAKKVLNSLPGASVHLPYNDINPGKTDTDLAMRDKLLKAVEISSLYKADHLVGHTSFDFRTDSVEGVKKYISIKKTELEGPSQLPSQAWLENSVAIWSEVLKNSNSKLLFENTYDLSPVPIMTLLDNLDNQASMCLDIGHWHHYAMGYHWQNLDWWLDLAAHKISHLHIHDNHGDNDSHFGLGLGSIDFAKVKTLLDEKNLNPTWTLENHFPEYYLASEKFLQQTHLFS